MRLKFIEIRDEATCIPALAIRTSRGEHDREAKAFLSRCGYPETAVILMRLADQRATSDPYEWGDRTHQAAHHYIYLHFDELKSGQVVDVRVLLGEATVPASAEIMP